MFRELLKAACCVAFFINSDIALGSDLCEVAVASVQQTRESALHTIQSIKIQVSVSNRQATAFAQSVLRSHSGVYVEKVNEGFYKTRFVVIGPRSSLQNFSFKSYLASSYWGKHPDFFELASAAAKTYTQSAMSLNRIERSRSEGVRMQIYNIDLPQGRTIQQIAAENPWLYIESRPTSMSLSWGEMHLIYGSPRDFLAVGLMSAWNDASRISYSDLSDFVSVGIPKRSVPIAWQ